MSGRVILPKDVLLYPRVSDILRVGGFVDFSMVNPDILARAQAFGSAVHAATELDDLNDLDESTLDDQIKPYLNAWRTFKSDFGIVFKPKEIEAPIYSRRYKFRGTPDRLPIVVRKKIILPDVKTNTTLYPAIGLQTAAYKIAWEEISGKKISERWGIQLKDDGKYKLAFYEDPSDETVFKGAVNGWRWKAKYMKGVLNGE